jgi:hypothetical protein
MKQTAVEWLKEALITSENTPNYNQWAFNKAKEMEKEQIMDAYWEIPLPEEKYFEKTFKSEKDENKR